MSESEFSDCELIEFDQQQVFGKGYKLFLIGFDSDLLNQVINVNYSESFIMLFSRNVPAFCIPLPFSSIAFSDFSRLLISKFSDYNCVIFDDLNLTVSKVKDIKLYIESKTFLHAYSNYTKLTENEYIYAETKLDADTIDYNYILIKSTVNLELFYNKFIHTVIPDYTTFLWIINYIINECDAIFVFDRVNGLYGMLG